jgi:putative membrane protein
MSMLANAMIGLVALLHFYFLILEMFLWTKPKGLKVFGQTLQQAQASAKLAANQGLYNGFLAAGLVWGLIASNPEMAHALKVYFLACVIIAGLYGAYSVNRKILFVQAVPALIALGLVCLASAPAAV